MRTALVFAKRRSRHWVVSFGRIDRTHRILDKQLLVVGGHHLKQSAVPSDNPSWGPDSA